MRDSICGSSGSNHASSARRLVLPMRSQTMIGLVFGDYDGLVSEGVGPDGRIIRMSKADIGNVYGGMTMLRKQLRERRR